MTKQSFPFITGAGHGSHPITTEQAALLFTPAQIAAGQVRGESKHVGPWQIVTGYRALAVSDDFTGNGVTVHGVRSLDKPRESGYCLEGRVSVGGKTFRGFTSSALFELPDGRLIDCAIIHVCDNKSAPAAPAAAPLGATNPLAAAAAELAAAFSFAQ